MGIANRERRTVAAKPLRYVLYLRCSSDDQGHGDFTTLDVQESINKRHVETLVESNGGRGQLVGVYRDEGKTGTNLKRQGWKDLLAAAEGRTFDVVVVSYMSRLARGEVFHVAEHLLKEEKVRVEMVREQFTPDMAGQMNKNLTILTDGVYPKMVSGWTKTRQAEMVAKGYHTGGTRPFGYRSETVPGMSPTLLPGGKVKPAPKRLVPDPEERAIVLEAFETMIDTNNMGQVQRYLRSAGTGRVWAMDEVRRLLTNDLYRGVQRFGESVNPTAHEAIVSEGTWDEVQELLAKRDNREPEPGGEGRDLGYLIEDRANNFPYYLRGLIYCGACSCRMTPFSAGGATRRVSYYQCIHCQKKGTLCPVQRVNAKALHTAVLAEIIWIASHPTRLTQLIREATAKLPTSSTLKAELARLTRNEREAERKARTCIAAIESARGKGVSPLVARVAELDEQLVAIRAEKEKVSQASVLMDAKRPSVTDVSKVWGAFGEIWEVLTELEREQLLRLIVEDIRFTAKNEGTLQLILQCSVDGLKGLSLPSGELYSHMLVDSPGLGAGARLELATFGL